MYLPGAVRPAAAPAQERRFSTARWMMVQRITQSEMRRSHIGAYEQRRIAWKKFTHVSEVRTASIVGREYVRKCTHNITILICPFLNFLAIQAIIIFCNANFGLIKVFFFTL